MKLEICREDFIFKDYPCDEDVFHLCNDFMAEHNLAMSDDVYEITLLFSFNVAIEFNNKLNLSTLHLQGTVMCSDWQDFIEEKVKTETNKGYKHKISSFTDP